MSDDEKMDRFVKVLKQRIRVEVLRAQVDNFVDSARVTLNVDGANWRAEMRSSLVWQSNSSEPTPLELKNVERQPRTKAQREQRVRDLQNGACFNLVSREDVGLGSMSSANNVEAKEYIKDDDLSDASSENE